MNCEDSETLMADAASGELSDTDRPAFEAHLAECAKCRLELESLQRTVAQMRGLPGASGVGDVPDLRAKTILAATGGLEDRWSEKLVSHQQPGRGLRRPGGGVFRFAASVLLAFAAGYGVHAGLMTGVSVPGNHHVVKGEPVTLTHALVSAHRQNPSRSDLANCLAAMFHPTR